MNDRTHPPANLTLISHPGCPYVQRVAIVLAEKGIPHVRTDVDLGCKPDWFLQASPMGKIPVLLIEGQPIFESAVICEYLEEAFEPPLHPRDPLHRAQHRAWMAFGTELLESVGAFYKATDAATMEVARARVTARLASMEGVLASGPFFAGERFSMVDAVFAPVFRYFEAFAQMGESHFLDALPKVTRWGIALLARESVQAAVAPEFIPGLVAYLCRQPSQFARQHLRDQVPRSP